MKVGQVVVCVEKHEPYRKNAGGKGEIVFGKKYVISQEPFHDMLTDMYFVEVESLPGCYWLISSFKPLDSKGISTEASRSLLEEIFEGDQIGVGEKKYIPEEEVFTTEEEF